MYNDQSGGTTMRPFVIRAAILGILLVVLLATRPILLGANVISLPKAAPLAGQISQALTDPATGTLLQAGKDYTLESTHYMQNDKWVVVTIKTTGSQAASGYVVLYEDSGIYKVMVGPGTMFPSTQINQLPVQVATYLRSLGVVYEPL